MASPAFVSATGHAGNPTATPTVTLPTTAANDILILVWINAGAQTTPTLTTGTFTQSANFALIDSGTWTTGAGGCHWVRCTGNHSGQTVICSGNTDSGSALVIRISGCITSGSPIDVATGASIDVPGPTQPVYTLTGFNTTVAETLVCFTAATDDNTAKSSPTKNSVAMSNLSAAVSGGGNDSGVAYADSSQASAGATGNFTITEASGTAQGKRLSAFSLKPPAVVAHERSAAIGATAAVASSSTFFTIIERVVSLAASAAVESAGAFFSTIERSASLGASADVSSAGVVEGDRFTGEARIQLSAAETPEAGDQTLRIRARAASGAGTLNVKLYDSDGVTVRGSDSFSLTGSFQTFTLTPTGITDFSALEIGFEGVTQTSLTAEVSWVEFEIPPAVGFATHERSASLSGTGALTSAAEFFTTLERATAISAVAALTVAHEHDHNRQAALSAESAITSAATFFTTVERSASLSASSALTAAYERELLRAAALAAAAQIASTGGVEGGALTHERSAALAAASAIASAAEFWSIIERTLALSAQGEIQAAHQRELQRIASLAAVAQVASDGHGILERAAALAALGAIESSGAVAGIFERAVLLAAVAEISARGAVGAIRWNPTADNGWPQDSEDEWASPAQGEWATVGAERWPQDSDSEWS